SAMNPRFPALAALLLMPLPLRADVTNIVRPDFQNITASGTLQIKNPSVILIQGHIKPSTGAPTDGAVRLPEASFGQPLAPWIPDSGSTGNPAFAARIAAEVRAALY